MTKIELARLAGALNVIRPDWPTDSLHTFLSQFLHRPLRDVAVAMTWVATDPDTRTPARVLEAGPWWNATRTNDAPKVVNDCTRHPETGIRLDPVTGRTTCAGCHADNHADPNAGTIHNRGGQPIPHHLRTAINTALHRTTPEHATPRPDATEAAHEERPAVKESLTEEPM